MHDPFVFPRDLSQARAVLLGMACGDALGAPTEFIRLHQIQARYGPQGIQEPPDPALYTDDTQMALYLTRALVEAPTADLDTLMAAVSRQFIAWLHDPTMAQRAPGNTCITGVRNLERGVPWRESGVARSKGCGSAMRVPPVGYLYQEDPDRLRQVASASGILTHGHPAADAASIGMAYLIKLALDGRPVEEWTEILLIFTEGVSEEFDAVIRKVPACLEWEDEEAALRYLGEGWVGEEAVALALYCVLRYPDDYAAAVRRGANSNGDSDSVACLAGALSAARLGPEAIPRRWLERLEDRDEIESLAGQLAEAKRRFGVCES
jgi:ADP-ribosylglycohydrolase